jgi:hypothetical protein
VRMTQPWSERDPGQEGNGGRSAMGSKDVRLRELQIVARARLQGDILRLTSRLICANAFLDSLRPSHRAKHMGYS